MAAPWLYSLVLCVSFPTVGRRFETLDGMRGVAAIAVFFHHITYYGGSKFLQSGYLAVDFFFMLSGFVLARAYDARFAGGLSPFAFLWQRIKRLWPVMAIGILSGAAMAYAKGIGVPELTIRTISQILFLPVMAGPFGIYTLDGVQWSLLFEFFANAIHGMFLWSASLRRLAVTAGAALIALSIAAWFNGSVGMGAQGADVLGGIPRVIFSYVVGVLIHRLWSTGRLRVIRAPSILVIAALPLTFIAAGALKLFTSAWPVDLLVVAVICPLLLVAGANTPVPPRLRPLAVWLGAISYPLYAIHLPVLDAAKLLSAGTFTALAAALVGSTALAVLFDGRVRLLPSRITSRLAPS